MSETFDGWLEKDLWFFRSFAKNWGLMKHFFTYVTIVTYVIFRNLAGSTSRNYFNVNIILEILDQCGIGNEFFLGSYVYRGPNKDDNKWSNEGQKGENKQNMSQKLVHLADWGIILPWGFCRAAEVDLNFGFPFSAWGQIGISKLSGLTPPMLDLKYLLDTGTIRSGLWHVL